VSYEIFILSRTVQQNLTIVFFASRIICKIFERIRRRNSTRQNKEVLDPMRTVTKKLKKQRRFHSLYSLLSLSLILSTQTEISRRQRRTLDIALDDLAQWTGSEKGFVQRIQQNALRYLTIFCEVIDSLVPPESSPVDEDDVWDILNAHRTHHNLTHTHTEQHTTAQSNSESSTGKLSTLPKELLRR
jgi:hypothetical protein